MKCQKCDRPATFHITELTGKTPVEVHLCEEHAREYLNDSSDSDDAASGLVAAIAQNMPKKLTLSEAVNELKDIDQQTCPVCGISFLEFRNRGRLGCPHDYVVFSEQLEPLIEGIHGSIEHLGKTPKKHTGSGTEERLNLIRLRRELEEAIECEDYEKASQLRDRIKSQENF